MAMLLRINKETYLAKINVLSGKLSQLESVKSRYDALLSSLSTDVVAEEDENFAKIEAGVKENIRAVAHTIKVTENAIAELQEVVASYDELTGNVSSTIDTAVETAGSALEAATHVFQILG